MLFHITLLTFNVINQNGYSFFIESLSLSFALPHFSFEKINIRFDLFVFYASGKMFVG